MIIKVLHQHGLLKESVEGIDRMFNEVENAGLPYPEYTDNAFYAECDNQKRSDKWRDKWRIKHFKWQNLPP